MFGETAIVGAINAIITQRKLDRWGRLILSCLASAFCSFFGAFGAAGIGHLTAGQPIALALAFAACEASIVMAAIVLFVWTHSPLTKGMPISVPASLEQAERKILEREGVTTIGSEK